MPPDALTAREAQIASAFEDGGSDAAVADNDELREFLAPGGPSG
jgi:hypothetical protein